MQLVDNIKSTLFYIINGGRLEKEVDDHQAFPPCCILLRSILTLVCISHIQIMG